MKPTACISCKFFKIEDQFQGYCRVHVRETGNKAAEKPRVKTQDYCAKWADCGQQYHIRLGWIRSREEKGGNPPH